MVVEEFRNNKLILSGTNKTVFDDANAPGQPTTGETVLFLFSLVSLVSAQKTTGQNKTFVASLNNSSVLCVTTCYINKGSAM